MVFLFAIIPADGLRMKQMKEACLDLDSDKFPLDVDGLLASSKHTKKTYFKKLQDMGLTESLNMVGDTLHHSCLGRNGKPVKLVFVGDSTVHQLFTVFLEHRGTSVSDDIKNERQTVEFNGQSQEEVIDELDLERFPAGSKHVENIGDHQYIAWIGGDDAFPQMQQAVDDFSQSHTVVFLLGTAVHNVQSENQTKKFPAWAYDRENKLRTFLGKMQVEFPNNQIIWDTPPFLDFPLMKAKPTIHRIGKFHDVMRQEQRLFDIDEKVCRNMKIPMTSRTKLGRTYRGLAADGIHYHKKFGSAGYHIFYELITQSALSEACTGKPANFCKNLDKDYNPSSGLQLPTSS